ncbi:MAG: hypothetical protein ACK5V3_08700 [Bdellovibrionales bacterium]
MKLLILKFFIIIPTLSLAAKSYRQSHHLTLPSVHGNQTLFLSEISHHKSKGYFVALNDQRKNETLYERIEKKDYQKRVNRLLKIIESDIKTSSKRNPSATCFEKVQYVFKDSEKVKKEVEFCWDKLSINQKNKILRWWKTGL